MDLFRQIWPQIVGTTIFFLLLWFAAFIVKQYVDKEYKSGVTKVARWASLIALICFVIYVIKIASVNEMSRSVIDRSIPEYSKDNFEERMRKAAAQPTRTDSVKKDSIINQTN